MGEPRILDSADFGAISCTILGRIHGARLLACAVLSRAKCENLIKDRSPNGSPVRAALLPADADAVNIYALGFLSPGNPQCQWIVLRRKKVTIFFWFQLS